MEMMDQKSKPYGTGYKRERWEEARAEKRRAGEICEVIMAEIFQN